MATTVKSFPFAANAEGFTDVGGDLPPSTASWDGSDGDPAGSLKSAISGNKLLGTDNYWEWTGTWEDLGVPTGGTITAVQLTAGESKVTIDSGSGTITVGPYEITDNAGANAVTLWSGRASVSSSDGSFVSGTGSSQSPPSGTTASSSSVRIRLRANLVSVGGGSAVHENRDQLEFTITYTPLGGPAPHYTRRTLAGGMTAPRGGMA